eukprot:CAMPEP_0206535310 /NCGR_PEP_ID=MMETSP0325_2-20121206/6057_1 /ASSEMBLY_ACC=CAM_ASM_000347 /TAXON_ID=2866 /ORGANISM="Crypthecodinium cohnii, Strain Seligo" /LENGTH=601 /DNA_ID=CAMNT_0054032265 /DNA_START=479 /DNA_END=2286 /DNA_ORIENTATION=+
MPRRGRRPGRAGGVPGEGGGAIPGGGGGVGAGGAELEEDDEDPRKERVTIFQRTKMCKFFLLGCCSRGDQCHFAHSKEQLSELPNLYRTKLCRTLINTGSCTDETCRYAHNKDELRNVEGFSGTMHNANTKLAQAAIAKGILSPSDVAVAAASGGTGGSEGINPPPPPPPPQSQANSMQRGPRSGGAPMGNSNSGNFGANNNHNNNSSNNSRGNQGGRNPIGHGGSNSMQFQQQQQQQQQQLRQQLQMQQLQLQLQQFQLQQQQTGCTGGIDQACGAAGFGQLPVGLMGTDIQSGCLMMLQQQAQLQELAMRAGFFPGIGTSVGTGLGTMEDGTTGATGLGLAWAGPCRSQKHFQVLAWATHSSKANSAGTRSDSEQGEPASVLQAAASFDREVPALARMPRAVSANNISSLGSMRVIQEDDNMPRSASSNSLAAMAAGARCTAWGESLGGADWDNDNEMVLQDPSECVPSNEPVQINLGTLRSLSSQSLTRLAEEADGPLSAAAAASSGGAGDLAGWRKKSYEAVGERGAKESGLSSSSGGAGGAMGHHASERLQGDHPLNTGAGLSIKNTFIDFPEEAPTNRLRVVHTAAGRLDLMGQE